MCQREHGGKSCFIKLAEKFLNYACAIACFFFPLTLLDAAEFRGEANLGRSTSKLNDIDETNKPCFIFISTLERRSNCLEFQKLAGKRERAQFSRFSSRTFLIDPHAISALRVSQVSAIKENGGEGDFKYLAQTWGKNDDRADVYDL